MATSSSPRPEDVHPARWSLKLSGTFAVTDNITGRDVTPRGRKARAIIAYLASRADAHVSRERLAELLWGDRGEPQARASLRQALLEIRHAAQGQPDLIESDREYVWIDAAHVGEHPLSAQVINCGDCVSFEDLDHITAEFDDWLAVERTRLTQERIAQLRGEAEQELAMGRAEAALAASGAISRIDRFDEDALRIAMEAEFRLGRRAAVEQRYLAMEQLLRDELGVEPAAESRALRERLLVEGRPSIRSLFDGPIVQPDAQPGAKIRLKTAGWRKISQWAKVLALPVAAIGTFWIQQGGTVGAQPERIAVLPFEAAGVEPALAEGISDELLSQLARSNQLRVIGRTSSSQFKGHPTDLRTIGRMLGVKYIVEGTVRSSGNQLTAVVSLVRARDGSAVWARAFKANSGSLQPIHAAIGGAIVQSLDIQPLPVATSTPNGEAFALYVRAKSIMRERVFEELPKAIELLRQAIQIDPNFAGAWAQIAGVSFLAYEKDVVVDLGAGKPVRMTRHQAAERALLLDPNLAEAHAMIALVDGGWLSNATARSHLQRALELNPGDTQTLFWWGLAVSATGDYRRTGEIMRRVAALDPLWKRPVEEAVTYSLVAGDRAAALRYLRTIKAGNPAAAVEVEVQMGYNEADFSRVIKLELVDPKMPWDPGKARAVRTLESLGFAREAMLLWRAGPASRAIPHGHAPPLQEILRYIRHDAEEGDAMMIYTAMTSELARERRWSDLAAIFDANLGLMQDVKGSDPGGRYYRQIFAPIYAIALKRVGRSDEAVRLIQAADDGAKFTLARGEVPPEPLVSIAGTEAVLGRKNDALDHLEEAFAKNWRLDEFVYLRIGDWPEFATLRGDPRFERLRRIQDAHIAKERREVLALRIF